METRNSVTYLRDAWYVAALSTEVSAEGLFARTLLNTPVLIYRKQDGSPVALQDRCPHRFVPLSMGVRDGDEVHAEVVSRGADDFAAKGATRAVDAPVIRLAQRVAAAAR